MQYSDILSSSAQTAYAQVFDLAQASALARTAGDLPGSFATKRVRGRLYHYYQYREPGCKGPAKQVYIGPDSERMRELIAAAKARTVAAVSTAEWARAAINLGCEPVTTRHYRIVKRLADYGLFRAGAILVGTHAFLAYGNMLGVRWVSHQYTQDLDFAHPGGHLALGLPNNMQLDLHDAISSLEKGFLPINALKSGLAATYAAKDDAALRIDFLTPLHRADGPQPSAALGVALQPLKFMEFSLEQTEQAAVFCNEGAILVNVPKPERFAVHKLIVSGERAGAFHTKATKDIAQAAALCEFLLEYRPDELLAAWVDATGRGPGWRSRATQGLRALKRAAPDIGEALAALIGPAQPGHEKPPAP
ncbi:nucleotidyltransferase domain-containing protein [Sulfurivermis fontis]|uniref:GSU2403 family nucleotidyltransferase fold protein n=1 Tax=Sulfurivermis fontis TaxID=1972068 RepID=UPI000FDA3822|nr:nucleotidyltransferase domain-containing protein [Sulfurivermis fontis]